MPEVHPPIGVFGSTIHTQGDVMLSYRFNREDYEGLMDGTHDVSNATVANLYEVIPTALRVSTHYFEAMWAPVEEFTVVASLPFYEKSLDWQPRAGVSGSAMTTTVKGFGDISLTFLYRVFDDEGGRLHLNLGLGFPSGSTSESALTPTSGNQLERLPYILQLGSGTIDIKPGATYNGYWRGMNWGAQILGVLHAGTNPEDYTKGNEYAVTGWAGRKWTRWFGTAFRLAWRQSFNPEGFDARMLETDSPLAYAKLQAFRRLDALFGFDFYVTGGRFEGVRLSVEAGLPAYQSVDGPQLRNRWSLTAGIQYAF
ncbi:MAG: transporter [Myxococcota bacterium]|nr:transporter [Myxococcota bacterium]